MVWLIKPLSDEYQALVADEMTVFTTFRGKRVSATWKAVPVKVDHPRRKAGAFPSLLRSLPVFTQKAWDKLGLLLSSHVEALPLKCKDGPLYAINILTEVDCMDLDRSKFKRFPSSGRIMIIDEYVFKKGKVGDAPIFKIPESNEPFVSDDFKSMVEKEGLEGLEFVSIASV
jgi:hypothetical protein